MIEVHKLNGEMFLLNEEQIEVIKFIPESKIILMNQDYYIVRESKAELLDKIMEVKRSVWNPPLAVEEK